MSVMRHTFFFRPRALFLPPRARALRLRVVSAEGPALDLHLRFLAAGQIIKLKFYQITLG